MTQTEQRLCFKPQHQCQSRATSTHNPKLCHPCCSVTVDCGTVHNTMFLQWRGLVSSLSFSFIIYIWHVGQVATGRSWHSASLHCQALLCPPLQKHKRCGQLGQLRGQSGLSGKIYSIIPIKISFL